jgi:hypothetical protein
MKLAFILFTLLLCAGCGGGTKSTQTPPPPPNGTLASGPWQFNQDQGTCESSHETCGDLFDFNLSQNGTQISTVGSGSAVGYGISQSPYSSPSDLEPATCSGQGYPFLCDSITGSINGNSVTLTLDQVVFQGTLNQDGSISGTTNNGGVINSFTAKPVSILVPNGTYSGTFSDGTLPGGNVALTINSGTNYQLTASITVDGNGPYSLTGQLVGNILLLSGTVESDPVSFSMYYDASGSVTGVANSLTVFTSFEEVLYSGQLTPQQ